LEQYLNATDLIETSPSAINNEDNSEQSSNAASSIDLTLPGIEMLVILNEKQYENFKRSGKKPSDYCKSDLHYHDVKSKSFLTDYFSDVNVLISAIREYRKKAQNRPGEFALTDILK